MTAYPVLRAPRPERLMLRGQGTHVTRWGPQPSSSNPPVVLLHGWQDTGDTFQFMVDSFAHEWPLIALDWRGFGRSDWAPHGYYFPDYLADLDALLDAVSPAQPVRLVGHSMGGNIASFYAGLRPERVSCLVNLEGFGMPRTAPSDAPQQLCQWLDQIKAQPPHKDYDSLAQLASVIRFRYPRFSDAQVEFMAAAWSRPHDAGVRLLGDPRHRVVSPLRYQRDDAMACWRAIRAPMLLLIGAESEYLPRLREDGNEAAFRAIIPALEVVRVAGAGHMLHIERADVVGPRIEAFLEAH